MARVVSGTILNSYCCYIHTLTPIRIEVGYAIFEIPCGIKTVLSDNFLKRGLFFNHCTEVQKTILIFYYSAVCSKNLRWNVFKSNIMWLFSLQVYVTLYSNSLSILPPPPPRGYTGFQVMEIIEWFLGELKFFRFISKYFWVGNFNKNFFGFVI